MIGLYVIEKFTILLTGFTIFSAGLLILAYVFFLPELQKSVPSKLACSALLIGLALLQWCHYTTLSTTFDALNSRLYLLLLLVVPASFYFFSRFVLFPDERLRISLLWHFLPVIIGAVLPKVMVAPLAFLIGTAYSLWFALLVLKTRTQHSRFEFERFFFGLFAVLAVVGLALGLLIPYIDHRIYYLAYANSIGIAMFLVLMAIVVFPDMLSDIQQIAAMTYAKSKLAGVDVDSKKVQLEALMRQESIYQNEKLSLSSMAAMLEMNPHQLSELVNTQYGYGFSRFVRAHRIDRAKILLVEEPDTSILAISIMTGFQSQSNFYSAFRELTSMSPGSYRKEMTNTTAS
ncbi:MAG: helix-turn-helix domain-containing protein [Pseudomonadota bacterium]